jgi:hypothetical protein
MQRAMKTRQKRCKTERFHASVEAIAERYAANHNVSMITKGHSTRPDNPSNLSEIPGGSQNIGFDRLLNGCTADL